MLREQRRLAIKLRKSGKSYNEIRDIVRVSKSSLSLWLRNYPLTDIQLKRLGKKKTRQIENFRTTMRRKREQRINSTYERMKLSLLPLSKRDILIAGLFLYLGEGAKQSPGHITVSNTDPRIIKFVLKWYTGILGVPKEKIKVNLQLYKDMDVKKEIEYWSSFLNIPESNFWRPYVKNSSTKDIDHSGSFKHGTCGLYCGSVPLHEEILMSIKCILDNTTIT